MEKKADFPQFNFNAPDQALEWKTWSKRFKLSLTLLPKKRLTEEKKVAALRLWAGVEFDALIEQLSAKQAVEGVKVPYAPQTNTELSSGFDQMMEMLESHFEKKRNAMYPMTAFRMMKQEEKESIAAFGARLRRHAGMCGAGEQDMILQVFTGAKLISVRKKAAKATDFEKLLSVAELEEMINKQIIGDEKEVDKQEGPEEVSVNFVQGGRGRQFSRRFDRPMSRRANTGHNSRYPYSRGEYKLRCANCNREHPAGADNCFAKDKVCYVCGIKGHLAACCRKKGSGRGAGGNFNRMNDGNRRKEKTDDETVGQVQEDEEYSCHLPGPKFEQV